MPTCNYVVVPAVKVLVNLRKPALNIPEGDHSQACCGTGLAMILDANTTTGYSQVLFYLLSIILNMSCPYQGA